MHVLNVEILTRHEGWERRLLPKTYFMWHLGTVWVTRVTWWKEAVHADHRKHGHSSQQGAQLHHSATPHEGAVALITQDHCDHHFDIRQSQNKGCPGEHLCGGEGIMKRFLSFRVAQTCRWYSRWRRRRRHLRPRAGDTDSGPPCSLNKLQLCCQVLWELPSTTEICSI